MSIDIFLANWVNMSEKQPDTSTRLYNDLEVTLSKSGRDNTVHLNALKSRDQKKGKATKFIKWLTKEARKGDFDITLCAQPWGHNFEDTPKKERVRDWLLGLGFTVKWEYPDEEGYEMEYDPRRQNK